MTSLSRDSYSDRPKNKTVIKFSLCVIYRDVHNDFTKKINLFKSKRFKDRRCTYKNTGSSHLNFCQGIRNGQGPNCCCWKYKSTSRNCSSVRMPKKFSIPQMVSAPRSIKSYILMETISAFFLRTCIIDSQTERR